MDRALHRNTVFVVAGVFLFLFLGFWPTYFSHPLTQPSWRTHFHAFALLAWCGLMVTQAYLIRTNRRSVHRQVGKLSYVIAPLVVIATLSALHYRLQLEGLSEIWVYSLAFVINLLIQFSVVYALAIYNRHNPVVHARFMICTVFPILPPIYDRVISVYVLPPEQAQFLPQVAEVPMYMLFSYVVTDVALVMLAIWDWKSRRRLNIFPSILIGFVALQALPFVIYRSTAWKSFSEWFVSLPLS